MTTRLNITKHDFDRVRRFDDQWLLHPRVMRLGLLKPAIPAT